jgi:hypothetical protein
MGDVALGLDGSGPAQTGKNQDLLQPACGGETNCPGEPLRGTGQTPHQATIEARDAEAGVEAVNRLFQHVGRKQRP